MKQQIRFPGLLRRDMLRRRKPGRQETPPLSAKFSRKVSMDGTIYETRPDGWRRVGYKG